MPVPDPGPPQADHRRQGSGDRLPDGLGRHPPAGRCAVRAPEPGAARLRRGGRVNATYADRLREILATYTDVCFDDFDPGADVAVLASHLHLRGARTSTERTIHISEDYATDAAAIDARYGYLAFGHIHVPQVVAGERGRYAGSILEVDFGEEGESKQVTVVDLEPGRPAAVHDVPLTVGRRLRRITLPIGSLDQLAGQAADAIVELTVTAEPGAAPDPAVVVAGTTYDSLAAAVADHLGDAVVVSVIDGRSRGQALELDDVETVEAPPLVDMFREWLAGAGVSVLGAGNGGRRPTGGGPLLRAARRRDQRGRTGPARARSARRPRRRRWSRVRS